ncbi:MAG: hypothetical protein H6999_09910 [Hahellaceae bacterium]|nr:hypothetical protein [Hahellaceae bacterium]MCP5170059.1 hypothetical protein [Hahellaceae bacterium]
MFTLFKSKKTLQRKTSKSKSSNLSSASMQWEMDAKDALHVKFVVENDTTSASAA